MSLQHVRAAIFVAFALISSAHAQESEAGFERRTTDAGIEVGIWYPASGAVSHQRLGLFAQEVVPRGVLISGKHPLVLVSHGTGGDFASHVDTAMALARAGFVVAALTHPGDNWRDASRATQIEERPPALRSLVSYMLSDWPDRASIDPERIGAFGFSAGGFTALVAGGGRPYLTRIASHCNAHPDFFDCALLESKPRASGGNWAGLQDSRIKAIVVAAPAWLHFRSGWTVRRHNPGAALACRQRRGSTEPVLCGCGARGIVLATRLSCGSQRRALRFSRAMRRPISCALVVQQPIQL